MDALQMKFSPVHTLTPSTISDAYCSAIARFQSECLLASAKAFADNASKSGFPVTFVHATESAAAACSAKAAVKAVSAEAANPRRICDGVTSADVTQPESFAS